MAATGDDARAGSAWRQAAGCRHRHRRCRADGRRSKRQPDNRRHGFDPRDADRRAAKVARDISWVLSDGLALAFSDDTFDAAISVFMMRNVPDVAQAFREQARVVRPGGRVVCLEMTWPRRFPISWLFNLYFFTISPLLGKLIARDRDAYTYLPNSVKQFPSPEKTAQLMEDTGLRDVSWEMKMLGTVAIFVGQSSALSKHKTISRRGAATQRFRVLRFTDLQIL